MKIELPVKLSKSKRKNYCSEASAQMLLRAYGYEVGQDRIHGIAPYFEHPQYLPFIRSYIPVDKMKYSGEVVSKAIREGKPVILREHLIGNHWHTVVVIGERNNEWLILCPNKGKKYVKKSYIDKIATEVIVPKKSISK